MKVETRLLLPYLKSHFAPHTGAERYPAISALAKVSGVGVRELMRLLSGNVPEVDFDTADALLSALDHPEAWRTDENLAAVYESQPCPSIEERPALAVVSADAPASNGPAGGLVTAAELAEYLGLSTATVLDRWERGDLPGFRLFGRKGGPVRFRLSEVETVLESWRHGPSLDMLQETYPRLIAKEVSHGGA